MKKTFAALALVGLLTAGTASAMGTSASVNGVVGLSSATVNYSLDDGVATLFGNVDSGVESALAQAHVEKLDGVEHVRNLITVN